MTAIAAAIIWLLMANDKRSWKLNAAVSSFLLLGLALNLRQPDPLEPVLPVEQIIEVMAGQGITGWILLGVSLCCIFLPALKLTLFYRSERSFGFAGMIYLLAQFVVPSIGNFPVPVIGAGAGPVIGFYLLMGLISISK